MKHVIASWSAAAAVMAVLAPIAAAQGRFAPPPARVSKPPAGGALTPASTASPRAVLAAYLRAQGRDEASAESSVVQSQGSRAGGLTAVTFEQHAAGLPVYGTYAKAVLNVRGELVHLIENLVAVPGSVGRARINEQQAITNAIRNLHPSARQNAPGYWHQPPSARRVAVPNADGSLTVGFVVETWTQARNELHYTLVGGDGSILEIESRTNRDSYNIFPVHPGATPQTVVAGPGAGNAESPSGWLSPGAQGSTDIGGNNVRAYLDVISNNKSDGSGTAVSGGNFLTTADLSATPSSLANRNVAVQNLFYLNNVLHDELYKHGFTEAEGNFQENNFGHGGRGSDSVNAEAQDGGGVDNANFATPRDGSNPRMQMYLWTGKGVNEVVVGTNVYKAQGAEFGPALTTSGVSGALQLVNDGVGTTSDGCEASPAGSLSAKIALVDRGSCDFSVKVKNAQNAGAVGVIVANNRDGDSILTMGGTDASITIPSVLVSQNDGAALRPQAGSSATLRKKDPPPLQLDGDLDSDIVYHEYCHGLTWRMIGRMSGPLAGAIGEGMSDVCSILMNGDDRIGEYSFSDSRGIRRFPYAGYPNTYSDVTGAEVHDDGEIYAAIGWQLLQNFGPARRNDLFDYIVNGMTFTPEEPTYEQMRDGILSAVAANTIAGGDDCLVWQAFAQFGVGVGAKGSAKGQSVTIAESFALPASCGP
jgi:extracellular elastinolytic metalloproteinase